MIAPNNTVDRIFTISFRIRIRLTSVMDGVPYMESTPPGLRLGNLLASFSLALDLQENRQLMHHRRTAYIAVRIGEILGIGDESLQNLFYGAMLHDIGNTECSGSTDFNPSDYWEHPVRGADLICSLPYLQPAGDLIRNHHERIDGQGFPRGLSETEIPIGSQVIAVADALEQTLSFSDRVGSAGAQVLMEQRLDLGAGTEFALELRDAAKSLFKITSFWLDLEEQNIGRVINRLVVRFDQKITGSDLNQIGEVFAQLIDGKSAYTANHSKEVANYSARIGQAMGLAEGKILQLYTAGLLHDLGKLGVPNAILNKPGPLNWDEMEVIKAHPYYTEMILRDIQGLEDVAAWAAMHHEKINGSGYHSACQGGEIPLEARIIAVGDAYQAMIADRPYRKGLPPEQAFGLLDEGIRCGYWDGAVVGTLKNLYLTMSL